MDSDSDAPLITRGRFGDLSSEDEEFEDANRSPTELPEVISAPVSVPGRPARLRLLKRMSQATTEVDPSGGDSAVSQEVSRRQGTWVEMTVEDSDDEDDEWDPDIRVFDALQRDLEGDVGPGSKFENDVSPSFRSAQRGSNMWGNTAASDVDSW